MKRNSYILIALFVLAVLAGYFLVGGKSNFKLDQYAPMPPGGSFSLNSAEGEVSLKDFAGKVVLIYFGYTYCPDICPTSLALTGAALKQLNDEELAQVQSIFISVDPNRDKVERLKEYTAFFHPNVLGLTGSKAQIDDIVKRYGAFYQIIGEDNLDALPEDHAQGVIQSGKLKGSASGYVVDHSSQTVLVGKNGEVAAIIAHGTLPDEMNRVIREHL